MKLWRHFVQSSGLSSQHRDDFRGDVVGASVLNDLETGNYANCIFCRVSVENGFDVVWENEDFIVFRDINPSARQHLQVVPKKHIDNVKALSKDDVSMVRQMGNIGHRVLDALGVPLSHRRLGFHIPPFCSVRHLHMHAQGLPYLYTFRWVKYIIASGWNRHEKGLSWFSSADQSIRILESGGRIGIFPC